MRSVRKHRMGDDEIERRSEAGRIEIRAMKENRPFSLKELSCIRQAFKNRVDQPAVRLDSGVTPGLEKRQDWPACHQTAASDLQNARVRLQSVHLEQLELKKPNLDVVGAEVSNEALRPFEQVHFPSIFVRP